MTLPTDRQPKLSDLIDRHEAARIMGCHANTIDRMAAAGLLKKYRRHGKQQVFYDRIKVEACAEPILVEEP